MISELGAVTSRVTEGFGVAACDTVVFAADCEGVSTCPRKEADETRQHRFKDPAHAE